MSFHSAVLCENKVDVIKDDEIPKRTVPKQLRAGFASHLVEDRVLRGFTLMYFGLFGLLGGPSLRV